MNLRSTWSIAIFFLVLPALCGAGDTKLTKKTIKAADGVNIVCEVRGNGDTTLIFLHGLCGERIGAYFSANRQLFDSHHNVNMMLSAGNGRHKSAMALAIAQTTSSEEEVIHALHRFWQEERLGLYRYLTGNDRFRDLFEDNQEHLSPDQLSSPLGLYLFLKLREGVTGKDVLIRTGCLGVLTHMGSGTYIRFSVGKITKPTYARYIRVG